MSNVRSEILCKLPALPEAPQSGPDCAKSPSIMPICEADEAANIITNSAELNTPEDEDWPSKFQFELQRLHRRVTELEYMVRDKDDRIVKALAMLEDEGQFWRSYLYNHIGDTYGGIQRRVTRLESALSYIRDKMARIYPPPQAPAKWQKIATSSKKRRQKNDALTLNAPVPLVKLSARD